jgi:7-cyano-7-deazaguanine synthase in queuosine biosynthesis
MSSTTKTLNLKYSVKEVNAHETIINLHVFSDNLEIIKIFWNYKGQIVPNEDGLNGNFALTAMLPYAMHHKTNIHLEGRANKEMIACLEECQDLWVLWRPDIYHRIKVTCDTLESPMFRAGNKAVMAFSGGVDACYSLHAHQKKLLGSRSREIDLGLLIVGFDLDRNNPEWIEIARDANRNILSNYDVKQTVVETNWKDYCVDWEMAFGIGVTTTLHHFNKLYSFGIWSADEDYQSEIRPWGNHSSQNSFLSERSFPIYATGAGLDRSAKVKIISGNNSVIENIRVCWAFPTGLLNCGKCEKCLRTYLNFKIAGVQKVKAISDELNPEEIAQVKIKHEVARAFYAEILRNSGNLGSAYQRAIRHALLMSKFYICIKKFLDRRPRLKRIIMSRIDPRKHY